MQLALPRQTPCGFTTCSHRLPWQDNHGAELAVTNHLRGGLQTSEVRPSRGQLRAGHHPAWGAEFGAALSPGLPQDGAARQGSSTVGEPRRDRAPEGRLVEK
jgi:hypothetical protein